MGPKAAKHQLHTIAERTPKDLFDAIPRPLYQTFFRPDGEAAMPDYLDGDHVRVTKPGWIVAEPR